MKKPIKVSSGEFITDANFNRMLFTHEGARSFAKESAKIQSRMIGHRLSVSGVRDCGEYFTYTLK